MSRLQLPLIMTPSPRLSRGLEILAEVQAEVESEAKARLGRRQFAQCGCWRWTDEAMRQIVSGWCSLFDQRRQQIELAYRHLRNKPFWREDFEAELRHYLRSISTLPPPPREPHVERPQRQVRDDDDVIVGEQVSEDYYGFVFVGEDPPPATGDEPPRRREEAPPPVAPAFFAPAARPVARPFPIFPVDEPE